MSKLAWTDADLEDVWNNGVDAGRAQERERIHALLQHPEFGGFLLWWAGTNPTAEDAQDAVASIVARIDGVKATP